MKEKENTISLQDIFRVLWKNIIMFAIITVAVTVAGAIYTFGIAKTQYKSSSSIIVAVASNDIATDVDYTQSLRAVITVSDAIKENKILDQVVSKHEGLTSQALAKKITVKNTTNSMMITITVVDENQDTAVALAQEIAETCIAEATDVKPDTGKPGVFFFAKNSIAISSDAVALGKTSPNTKLYLLVSFVLGVVVSCVVIFVKEFMSNKFTTRQEIATAFDEKIIGSFPDVKGKEPKKGPKVVTLIKPSVRSFEPYNKLLSNIKYSNLENPNRAILFTSTLCDELKSTIVSNLAYCIANNNQKVVLIDLDLRKSTLHKTFSVSKENGIVDYVAGDIDRDTLIKHTEVGVDIITAGKDVINPVAVIETTKLKNLIAELKQEYDYVLIDTAPSLACSDAQIISTYSDAVLYNIAVNQAKKKDIADSMANLKNAGSNILGIVVTKSDAKANDYYYYSKEE